MSYSFSIIEHTADIAIEVMADSLEELFLVAALGWKEIVIEGEIKKNENIKLKLEGNSLESLLVMFLDKLNYYFLVKEWCFNSVAELKIDEVNGVFTLISYLLGDNINDDNYLKEEIKAVTYHQMEIIKSNNNYSTKIIFDV